MSSLGRPAPAPDAFHRRRVEAMARCGIPEPGIVRVLAIAPELREHCRAEVDTAPIVAEARIAESLFCKVTGDHREAVTVAEDATLARRRRLHSEG